MSDKKSEELAAACSTCGDAYCESKLHIHCMKKYYLGMRDWTMGSNYYVKTFLGDDNPTWNEKRGDFYWTYHKYAIIATNILFISNSKHFIFKVSEGANYIC